MTPLEQQIYSALTGDSGIQAIIGTRLYLVQIPQNPTYPCAAFQRVSTLPIYSHSPAAGQQAGVGWARYQFSCWAGGASGGQLTEQFALALRNVLQTFNAWALPGSPEVLAQTPNFILNRRMGIEPQTQPPLFRAIVDVKIYYQDQ